MVFWARPGTPGCATASCQRVAVADPIFIDNERSNDMATLLQALRTHGPKLVYNRTATTAELAEWLAGRTGLTRGQVLLVLSELHDAIKVHASSGTPVMLDGIGRMRPAIGQDGAMRLHLVPDRRLTRTLGNLDDYRGEIANRANIGISCADFKAMWDTSHPEDSLELPAERTQAVDG